MMSDNDIKTQATAINTLFSKIARRINKLETGDLAIELPVAQMRVCVALLEKPRTMGCLSKELGISMSAVTQLADRLEKAELVERYAEPDDLRVKRLRLSERGKQIMISRRERRVARFERALELMSVNDRSLVEPIFQKLYEASLMIDNQSETEISHANESILY
jgi:DNA-binding MarR family transcriptional regulator